MIRNAESNACTPELVWARALQSIERVNQGRQPVVPDFFSRVREVVVIASSSRGGSSIFTEILRQSPDLIHFKGETNPMLAIAGLTYPASGRADDSLLASDAGPHNRQKLSVLEREMALDVGVNEAQALSTAPLRQRFMADLIFRITIQWPEIEVDQAFADECIEETFAELGRAHGWQPDEFNDPPLFHVLFLARLRRRYPGINPHYYDLAPDLIKRYCPDAEICLSPPAGLLIEEPPFVLISPRHPITAEMLTRRPLVIKTPSNVYRLAFLQTIFAKARFRILHLVRSPADSINGLVDGWLYHGFFSHALPARLEIKGYSNRFPEWGGHWWNYDLPPGWQQWTTQSLEQVCGYQWRHAHQAALDFIAKSKVDALMVAFEDVIGPLAVREQRFAEIADWLDIDRKPLIAAATGELPPVMATACPRPTSAGIELNPTPAGTQSSPRQRRWFQKAELLRPVLAAPSIIKTAKQLGYETTYDLPE